jgi:AraC-like DNA-binding protein
MQQPRLLSKSKYLKSNVEFHRKTGVTHVELHWHEFYEVTLIASGNGRQHLNGVPHPLHKGTLFFTTPTDLHEFFGDVNDPLETLVVVFNEELLDKDIYPLFFNPEGHYEILLTEEEFPVYNALFERISLEQRGNFLGKESIIKGCLQQILVDLVRKSLILASGLESRKFMFKDRDPIHRSLVYLQYNFREQVTLADISREVHMSQSYFSERFSKEMGIPFQKYLQDMRLEFAEKLLRSTELPVTEICMKSGFNSLPHFERTFKKKFGMTPRDMRRNR